MIVKLWTDDGLSKKKKKEHMTHLLGITDIQIKDAFDHIPFSWASSVGQEIILGACISCIQYKLC